MRFDRYPNVAELTKWTAAWPSSAPAAGGPGSRVFQYDALGRRNREPYNKELYYDAFGNIMEEREPLEVTQYVWGATGGNHLILRDRDTDGERDTPAQSTLPAGIDQRIYAITDAVANVAGIIYWAAPVLERYAYTPEGKLQIVSAIMSTELGASRKNWLYTYQSGRRDGEHLYYIGGKVYDYRTAGALEPEPYQVWGIRPSMTPPAMSWYGKEASVFWSAFASEALGRAGGWAQMAFGAVETVLGYAASSTGIGAMIGVPAALHGLDNLQAGLRTAAWGEPVATFTQRGIAAGARWAGASDTAAEWIGLGGDIALGIGLTGGSAAVRAAALRARGLGAPILGIAQGQYSVGAVESALVRPGVPQVYRVYRAGTGDCGTGREFRVRAGGTLGAQPQGAPT